ncbi:eukaryotic translation initiation factor 5B-like [Palaemon carinicauda]|uniref:eukaryotic translation initiation factor 5B-like n=1 Tax=Palaemon carinicauda TaxID=392227 RepID=UPI0035B67711
MVAKEKEMEARQEEEEGEEKQCAKEMEARREEEEGEEKRCAKEMEARREEERYCKTRKDNESKARRERDGRSEGIGSEEVTHICRLKLSCDLVTGNFDVAVKYLLAVEGVDILLSNEVSGAPFMPCTIVTEKPLKYSPKTELKKDYPYLFPSCVTTRSMKKKVPAEEEKEIEGAMNMEGYFYEEEDTQKKNSRRGLSKEERQMSGQENKEEKEIKGAMNLEVLFSEEEDSVDDTQEENSRVSPSEEEQQTSGQEDEEKKDLEEMNLEVLFSEEKDSLDGTQEENSRIGSRKEE